MLGTSVTIISQPRADAPRRGDDGAHDRSIVATVGKERPVLAARPDSGWHRDKGQVAEDGVKRASCRWAVARDRVDRAATP